MAKKTAGSRRKATPEQLADLKAAKARGLHTIDLRKPLTSYARDLARKFRGLSKGTMSAVTINEPNAKKKGQILELYKKSGYTVKGDKVLIRKQRQSDTVRFNKKTGAIVRVTGEYGQRVSTPVILTPGSLPTLKKRQRYVVTFTNQYGQTDRTFAGQQSLMDFMNGYEDAGTNDYYDWFVSVEDY